LDTTLEFVAPGARKIEPMREEGKGGKREKWLCDSAEAAAGLGAGLAGGKSAGKLQLQRLDKRSGKTSKAKQRGPTELEGVRSLALTGMWGRGV